MCLKRGGLSRIEDRKLAYPGVEEGEIHVPEQTSFHIGDTVDDEGARRGVSPLPCDACGACDRPCRHRHCPTPDRVL